MTELQRPSWSVGRFLRSLAFSIGMILATVVWSPVVMLCWPFPLPKRYWVASRWGAFVLWWLKITCGIGFEVRGLENIPQRSGVVAAKHQSTWETLQLPLFFQPMAFVLKRELQWLPFFGWALAALRPIAIDRGSRKAAMRQVLEGGVDRIKAGQWLLLFPEGTRMAAGTRGRYRPGAAAVAIESNCPLVPVAHNAGFFWGRRQFLKTPGTIELVIGEPIYPDGRNAQELTNQVEAWIESTVAQMRTAQQAAPVAPATEQD